MKLGMNAACVAEPAVIVLPTDEYDVSRALLAAQSLSMEISVRGGGHSYTCNSFKNNSLHIDMRSINNIQLSSEPSSPTGLAAVLGAGATWGEVRDYNGTKGRNYLFKAHTLFKMEPITG